MWVRCSDGSWMAVMVAARPQNGPQGRAAYTACSGLGCKRNGSAMVVCATSSQPSVFWPCLAVMCTSRGNHQIVFQQRRLVNYRKRPRRKRKPSRGKQVGFGTGCKASAKSVCSAWWHQGDLCFAGRRARLDYACSRWSEVKHENLTGNTAYGVERCRCGCKWM